jgi:hypothetical protein
MKVKAKSVSVESFFSFRLPPSAFILHPCSSAVLTRTQLQFFMLANVGHHRSSDVRRRRRV